MCRPIREDLPQSRQPLKAWLDITVILDASDATAPFVRETFRRMSRRVVSRPDADGVAVRLNLIACAGLVAPWAGEEDPVAEADAQRRLTVSEAIRDCRETQPPPQVLVLMTDRAPTGPWQVEIVAWEHRVHTLGGTPLRLAMLWRSETELLDGFAERPWVVERPEQVRRGLESLLRRGDELSQPCHAVCRMPPRRVKILKPFSE